MKPMPHDLSIGDPYGTVCKSAHPGYDFTLTVPESHDIIHIKSLVFPKTSDMCVRLKGGSL